MADVMLKPQVWLVAIGMSLLFFFRFCFEPEKTRFGLEGGVSVLTGSQKEPNETVLLKVKSFSSRTGARKSRLPEIREDSFLAFAKTINKLDNVQSIMSTTSRPRIRIRTQHPGPGTVLGLRSIMQDSSLTLKAPTVAAACHKAATLYSKWDHKHVTETIDHYKSIY